MSTSGTATPKAVPLIRSEQVKPMISTSGKAFSSSLRTRDERRSTISSLRAEGKIRAASSSASLSQPTAWSCTGVTGFQLTCRTSGLEELVIGSLRGELFEAGEQAFFEAAEGLGKKDLEAWPPLPLRTSQRP